MSVGVLVAMGAAAFEPATLPALSRGPLHVVRRCVDIADLLATSATRQADVAVVSAALTGLDAELLGRIESDGIALIGVAAASDSPDEALLRSLGIQHVGAADDLVSLVELITAVASDRAVAARVSSDADAAAPDQVSSASRGQVVAVWGPTGAPGRSTVATAVASSLAVRGRDTLLIDADVYGGTAAIRFGVLDEISGLLAAARAANAGTLDGGALAGHARLIAPHLSLLTGLPRADRWTEVKAVLMTRVLQAARQLAEYVVVDLGFSVERDEEVMYDTAAPRRNGLTLEVLERADVLLLVGAADPVGLTRMVRAVHEVQALGFDARQHLVVNRHRAGLGWTREEVTATLRRAIGPLPVSHLPDDQPAVDSCLVHGATLYERSADSRLVRAVDSLVHDVFGLDARQGRRAARPVRRRRAARVR